jgi:hypothetical protein
MSWTSVLTVRSGSRRFLAIVRVSAPPAQELQSLDPAGIHDFALTLAMSVTR